MLARLNQLPQLKPQLITQKKVHDDELQFLINAKPDLSRTVRSGLITLIKEALK